MFALKTKSPGWLVSPGEFSLVDIWPATRCLKWSPEERRRNFEMATSNLFYRTEPSLCKFQSSTAGIRPNFDQVRISNRFTKDPFESWRMFGNPKAPLCYTDSKFTPSVRVYIEHLLSKYLAVFGFLFEPVCWGACIVHWQEGKPENSKLSFVFTTVEGKWMRMSCFVSKPQSARIFYN